MKRSLGAKPPENCQWEIGKTALTIRFVREAELFLDEARKFLSIVENRVQNLKNGDLSDTDVEFSDFVNDIEI